MKWYRPAFLASCLAVAAFFYPICSSAEELSVSAALSLRRPFEEIGALFEKRNPGVKIVFNFGASGVLARQITAGARVDVFASASVDEMNMLERESEVLPGTRTDFAGNSIVLTAPPNSKIRLKSFTDLADGRIERIAIGNPSTVPAGRYAAEALTELGLWEKIKKRLIYCENVAQVVNYVSRGEADAGLVFLSDALSAGGSLVVVAEAPLTAHKRIAYVLAALKGSAGGTAAKKFMALVVSDEGSGILRRYGFKTASR